MSESREGHCDICQRVPENDSLLFESDFWKVKLGNEQRYVGRSYVTCKRHVDDLSSLTEQEWSDFHAVVKKYEKSLQSAFHATLFNWSCLMNNAFKHQPYFSHVHWHVKPRYDHD